MDLFVSLYFTPCLYIFTYVIYLHMAPTHPAGISARKHPGIPRIIPGRTDRRTVGPKKSWPKNVEKLENTGNNGMVQCFYPLNIGTLTIFG